VIALLLALAFTVLPQHVALRPSAPPPAGRLAFGALVSTPHVTPGARATTFAVPLSAAEIGGIPRRLRARLDLRVPASAGTTTLVDVRFNGALIGARYLTHPGTVETLDVAIPAAFVGSSNELIVEAGSPQATLLPSSAFVWDGLRAGPETIADFLKIAHGRAIVLLDPAFAPAAANIVGVLTAMNPSLTSLDVRAFDGTIPPGYDEALVFARPRELAAHFGLPIHGGDAPFRIENPLDDAVLVDDDASATAATLQVGHANGAPLLALSYVADPRAIDLLAHLTRDDLQVQVGNVALATPAGLTAYDVGPKLRIVYVTDGRLLRTWNVVKLPLAIVLLVAIGGGGVIASRRLAQKPAAA
jgi:hypothetical protein